MKAIEIEQHMQQVGTWVDWSNTVDTFKAGDPETEVSGIAVMWIVGTDEIEQVKSLGCNVIVCHEPVYYLHRTNFADSVRNFPVVEEKRRVIADAGITIFRCHDVWDRMPNIGIPWAWARFLGLVGPPITMDERTTQHVYGTKPMLFEDLVRQVKGAVAGIGESVVQCVGDLGRKVRKVGVGTGCICRPMTYQMLGADAGVICDDGTSYWGHVQWARDVGFPVVRVNHGSSEEPGMVTLAEYLRETFPDVPVHHIPQGCRYRTL